MRIVSWAITSVIVCLLLMSWLLWCLVKSFDEDDIDTLMGSDSGQSLRWNSKVLQVDDDGTELAAIRRNVPHAGRRQLLAKRVLPRRVLSGGYVRPTAEEDALCAGSSGGESEQDPSLVDSFGPISTGGELHDGEAPPRVGHAPMDVRIHIEMPHASQHVVTLQTTSGAKCVLPLAAPVRAGQSLSFSVIAISAAATAQGLQDPDVSDLREGRVSILAN